MRYFLVVLGYFDPAIWGTVCDWCIFIATASTGLFIYFTLRSQAAGQRDQREMLELQQSQFRKMIRPEITLITEGTGVYGGEFYLKIDLVFSNNTALNVTVTNHSSKILKDAPIVTIQKDHIKPSEQIKVFSLKLALIEASGCELFIIIRYSDGEGNRYEQKIYGNISRPKLSIPEFIPRINFKL